MAAILPDCGCQKGKILPPDLLIALQRYVPTGLGNNRKRHQVCAAFCLILNGCPGLCIISGLFRRSCLWYLNEFIRHVHFCWIPSHCGIDGNERVDQLAKETIDQDIDPLASVHYTDVKPLVNSYIQKLVQTKWDVAVHGRDLYLVKPTLGPTKKFQPLTRAEEVVITRLRIGHTKATKSHILSRGPPTGCHHCGQTLTIDHMLLECALLQECRDEYYTVDSLNALFETIPETCIVEFLREAGFFYLIWCNSLISTSPQTCPGQYDRTWVIVKRMKATLRHIYLCRTANMSRRTCVGVKQIQSNQNNFNTLFFKLHKVREKWL